MYSVGVVLWELWSGVEPWEGLHGRGFYRVLVEEKQTLPLGEEHRDIAQLLQSVFSPRPEQRPSIEQVLLYNVTYHHFVYIYFLQAISQLKELQMQTKKRHVL